MGWGLEKSQSSKEDNPSCPNGPNNICTISLPWGATVVAGASGA